MVHQFSNLLLSLADKTFLLPVERLSHADNYPEIKDPSIVAYKDHYIMYASIGRSSDQCWKIGRFEAFSPAGPWRELAPVSFVNVSGPEICAPAVSYDQKTGVWHMYVQTTCFSPGGTIIHATSNDGKEFSSNGSVVGMDEITSRFPHVMSIYDAGFSDIVINNIELETLVFSGYRTIGSGDLYVAYREKGDYGKYFSQVSRILAQEEVPFHNPPNYEHFEWGLEGAKIVQLAPELFLLIGVCFLPLPNEYRGTRQRVFVCVSNSFMGPFFPLGIPFAPSSDQAEHGHPDTLLHGDRLFVVYQERMGVLGHWHLRHAFLDVTLLKSFLLQSLERVRFDMSSRPSIKLEVQQR